MLLRQRPSCAQAILCSLAVLLSPVLCPRPAPGQYTTLVDSGPSSNRVDMVLMGDGYTAGEIPVYVSAAWSLVNYMFNPGPLPYVTDPYPRYANFFNVHRIDVVSNESGADRPPEGIWRDTALGASYYFDGGPDRLLYIDTALGYAALSQALQGAPFEAEVRPVIVNDSLDGGGGGYGDFAVYAGADVGPPVPPETALHELGHAFNWLDDEYVTDTLAYGGPEPGAVNVSTDPTGGKWWPWLGYDQPGVGVIGAYEGGGGAGWEMRWDAGLGTDFASSPPASALAPYLFQVAPGGSPYFGNAVTVAGDATINVRGTAILGSLAVGEAVSTARLEVLDVDGLFVCEGLEISADCTLVKAGGGTATFEGPQTHGADALLLVEDGTVNLNTDAGSATEANLDIEVIAGTVNFGSTQHLDELRIGAEGLARITSGGSKVLVLNFLWIDTGTPLGVGGGSQGVVPEPGTLSLLALGGLVLLRRRCGASS